MKKRGSPVLLTLLLAGLLVGCGGGSGGDGDPTGPEPNPDPDPDPTLELRGDTIFGIDLANNLFIVGTENADEASRVRPIQGLPPSHRIVGADFRRSDGLFYGVGTDSRVYVIDTETAVATAVSDVPFSPAIFVGFDVHFGMAIAPVTERIRLISAESGLSWSIDPDDGTAVTGPKPKYAAGDPNEGATPHISGLAFGPSWSPAQSGSVQLAGGAGRPASLNCDQLLYAIDPDLAYIVGTCDPDRADWVSLFDLDLFGQFTTRCTELTFDDFWNDPNAFGPPTTWVTSTSGGKSSIDQYEYNADGTITHIRGPDIKIDSPAQSLALEIARSIPPQRTPIPLPDCPPQVPGCPP